MFLLFLASRRMVNLFGSGGQRLREPIRRLKIETNPLMLVEVAMFDRGQCLADARVANIPVISQGHRLEARP